MDDQQIKAAVTSAIGEYFKNNTCSPCSSSRCQERCGFTPVQHAEDHAKLKDLFGVIGSTGKRIWTTIIAMLAIYLLGALSTGLIDNITSKLGK